VSLKYGGNLSQLDITEKYLDWLVSLPWDTRTEDILDINKAKAVLDQNHFGLEKIKSRIMEYLSVLIMQRKNLHSNVFHAPSLFFVGLAGTGKTTFAKSLAESLGRKFARIPFGGLSSALDLRGQPKTNPIAEPGNIIRSLRRVQSKNPVILLDELDRVTPEARSSVMGALLEILDPGQNVNFTDYYLDYPFDLSEVLFVATANNTNNVATAVLDRLEVIQMPSYTDEEKMAIGKKYVLPKYLKNLGLSPENVTIDDSVWPQLVRPLGFEPGIRSLERMIEQIVRRAAYRMVSGQGNSFVITTQNLKEFINQV
jgi:ATP-dependent Lon protease